MSVWAIMMVKDEADVIEPVLRHIAAQGVNGIIVADNGSEDGTWQLIENLTLDCALFLQYYSEVGYWQSRKMTKLANQAHRLGAEWIWPCDADELWYYGATDRLADVVARASGDVIRARLWHHFPTSIDSDGANPFARMTYRGQEAPLGKVIVRWREGIAIDAGNHDALYLNGALQTSTLADVQIRHFPYRSEDQFVRKAVNGSRAYAATDLPWSVGQHWREYGTLYERGGEDALREAYRAHFHYDLPSADGLVYDPARLDA